MIPAITNMIEVAAAANFENVNVQLAPYPNELADLVRKLDLRPSWHAELDYVDRGQGSAGLTLSIFITEPDAYHYENLRSVVHLFPVPPAAYDRRSWQRWLLGCTNQVSLHEDMEHFTVDGEKPYAPSHGPGNDPYLIREVGTDLDQRTSFRGEVNP